jgi:hypothetical protein
MEQQGESSLHHSFRIGGAPSGGRTSAQDYLSLPLV